VSTPELYKKIDSAAIPKRPDNNAMEGALLAGDLGKVAEQVYNVFDPLVTEEHLEMNYIKSIMNSYGALAYQMTGSGSAVFAINWTYQYASMNDEAQSSVVGQGIITPIPGTDKAESATVNGGMPLMITSGCKHPDEAWEYMLFLASREMQARYCANALPIWKSLYTDPQVIETAGAEVVAASQIQFDYIVNRPMVPYYNELSTAMQSEIQLVLLGQKTAQEALTGLQATALELADRLRVEVLPRGRPPLVRLHEHGAEQPPHGLRVGEDPDDLRAPLHLAVQPLEVVRRAGRP
jgi:hypothetical protein